DGPLPGAARVHQPPDRLHCRQTTANHVGKRRVAGEDGIAVRQLRPLVGELRRMEDVQRLEDADYVRNAGKTVGIEDAVRVALHLVERAVADAAEQRARFLVADLPARHYAEERFERRRRQPFTLGAYGKI